MNIVVVAYLVLGIVVLVGIGIQIATGIRNYRDRLARRSRVNELKEVTVRKSTDFGGDFCILLRSTVCDSRFSSPFSVAGKSISDDFLPGDPTDARLRQYLFQKTAPFYMRLIKNEQIDEAIALDYGDNDWQRRVTIDLKQSAFILAIPIFPSHAVLWELESIQKLELIHKLFFVMPPAKAFRSSIIIERAQRCTNHPIENHDFIGEFRHGTWRSNEYISRVAEQEISSEWGEATTLLKRLLDIDLGCYSAGGGIWRAGRDGRYDVLTPWPLIEGAELEYSAKLAAARLSKPTITSSAQ